MALTLLQCVSEDRTSEVTQLAREECAPGERELASYLHDPRFTDVV